MFDKNIHDEILRRLYDAYFKQNSAYNIEKRFREEGWDESTFRKTVDYLISHEKYIRTTTAGGNHKITVNGIAHAEEKQIAPIESINKNRSFRVQILEKLAEVYETSTLSSTHIYTLIETTKIDKYRLASNLQYLAEMYYVEIINSSSFRINHQGIEKLKDLKARAELAIEFQRVSKLPPNERGRSFEKIFAKIVEQSFWNQQRGVRTSSEEMDIIFHKGREYFLVECKWEKNRIGGKTVRELYGKLSNRIGVQGIVVSMSGFTKEAIKQVRYYINLRPILLFGNKDVNRLINEEDLFDNLLAKKYDQLITKGEVVFE